MSLIVRMRGSPANGYPQSAASTRCAVMTGASSSVKPIARSALMPRWVASSTLSMTFSLIPSAMGCLQEVAAFQSGGHDTGSDPQKERDMAGNAEMIIELDKKRMTAMAQKDVAALKNMLCKGLVYTHS